VQVSTPPTRTGLAFDKTLYQSPPYAQLWTTARLVLKDLGRLCCMTIGDGIQHIMNRSVKRSLWMCLHDVNIYGMTLSLERQRPFFQVFKFHIANVGIIANENLPRCG